ncbi:MAG: TonB-dependent receptor [Cyclobacteriaceae bacterium]
MKNKLQKTIIMLSKCFLYGLVLQTLLLNLVLALNANGQYKNIEEVRVTLSADQLSLNQFFREVQRQTPFKFSYEYRDVDRQQSVTFAKNEGPVIDFLREVAQQSQLSFRQVNHGIDVLKRKDSGVEVMAAADAVTISGTVVDENGGPLPGATITVEGSLSGTVTDIDGNYSIDVAEGAVLVVSFIGYKTIRINVSSQSRINIAMELDESSLEEVVVIGYGTVERRDVTGSVSSIQSEQIIRTNPTQTAKALQGQVAGVNIKRVSSQPGAEFTIDIRGLSSISFNNEPLVVIDGVMGGKLSTLNPSDIETIDVLKDASATAIYGARGANGVVLVTTKKGVSGKTKVTYDAYAGVKVAQIPDLFTTPEFYRAYNDVVKAENPNANVRWTEQELFNINAGNTVNWSEEVTAPALQTSHVVALSGGNENTTHYFSTGYLNEKGNMKNTGFERYSLNGSIDSKLNKVVKVGFSNYFTYTKHDLGSWSTMGSALRSRPMGSIYYDDLINPTETNDRNVDGYAMWMGIKDTQTPNPLVEVQPDRFQKESSVSNFLGNGYIEITPLKGLSFKSSLSTSLFNNRDGFYRGTDAKGRVNKSPLTWSSNQMNTSFTLDNILNYQLKTGMHNLNITAAQSALEERFEMSRVDVEGLPYNSGWYALQTAGIIRSVSSRLTERSILSYMGRFNYSFNDKYLVTLTGRRDGSSVLAEGNKWAFFPSVAVAWRAGEESFIKNMNTFSSLKFRLSYGQVGNDVVAPYTTQAFLNQTVYDFDGNAAFGYAPNNIGNADLRWEKSSEINLGIDMGFFRNRVEASIELYDKTTKDLIQNIALPTFLGFDVVTANVGKVRNRGVEISLNTVNIQTSDIRWTTNINFSANRNEILELYGGDVTRDVANSLFVGESLGSHYWYEFDGIWQLDEAEEANRYNQIPGSVKVVDQNNDGQISANVDNDDRVILGNESPKWIGGINNTLNYKNWDFSALIYTRQGLMYRSNFLRGTMGELTSSRYNSAALNYWTEENPTNDYFGVWQPNPYREAITYKEANFVRISNVTLGYTLPKTMLDRLNFSNFRLYVQADNPFIFTEERNHWFDPEYNKGMFQDDFPFSTYIFGVSVSF